VSVLLGIGNGAFQAQIRYPVDPYPQSVATGDFNADGRQDLVSANRAVTNGTVSILLGNGDGTFQPATGYPVGSDPHSVAVGDFNAAGRRDLATANAGSQDVSILLGNGDGTFQGAANYPLPGPGLSVAVGDFNSDSHQDLAIANSGGNRVFVLLGN